MKTKRIFLLGLALLALAGTMPAATNDISALLQRGLLEEEANHNLAAAIRAYQAIVTQTDKDHQFAATAVFHLAECFRKLGRTNEANVQYQRIIRDFSDQVELVKLSRTLLGTAAGADSRRPDAFNAELFGGQAESPEAQELKRIQARIKDSPDLINAPYSTRENLNSRSALHAAAELGYLAMAKFLIDNKADLNLIDRDGNTPLHTAVRNRHGEMMELLLANGADPNAGTAKGLAANSTPLHLAVTDGQKSLVEILLANKADVNAPDALGSTSLHLSTLRGFKAVAEVLLAKGARINARNNAQETPLIAAASGGTSFGAAPSGIAAVADLLVAKGADVNASATNGYTALIKAIESGQLELAKELIARGADVNASATNGHTALIKATEFNQLELARELIARGADVNASLNDGTTPLISAMWRGRLEIMRLLLAHGAEVSARLKVQNGAVLHATALHGAIEIRNAEAVKLLLENGAGANLGAGYSERSFFGSEFSPLMRATALGEKEVAELLLRHHAEVNARNEEGFSPLLIAAVVKQPELVKLLVAAGADIRVKDKRGLTPLHWAATQNQPGIAELLLEKGADVNARDEEGHTPLDSVFSGAVPVDTKAIEGILRKYVALQSVDLDTIRVTRGAGGSREIFWRDKGGHNNFTLFEVLAALYANDSKTDRASIASGRTMIIQTPNTPIRLDYPDFSKLEIIRLNPKGGTEKIPINLETALKTGDRSQNLALEWGDRVEIPELDHPLNVAWEGLAEEAVETLVQCLKRKVQIVVKEDVVEVMLYPFIRYGLAKTNSLAVSETPRQHRLRLPNAQQRGSGGGLAASETSQKPVGDASLPKDELMTFRLNDFVRDANVLRASSDLTRVKVKRTEPANKKTEEMIFDLEKQTSDKKSNAARFRGVEVRPDNDNNDLWLRDGDVIEIPEKP